jgi:hypothetical protein
LCSRGIPSHAFGGLTSRPACVTGSSHGRIGWPLSGLPALLGFFTFRPSRRRSDSHGERAHGFASRIARVAGGAKRSELPRHRVRPRLSPRPDTAVHR